MLLCLVFVEGVQSFGFNYTVNETPTGSRSVALSTLEMKTQRYRTYKNSFILA